MKAFVRWLLDLFLRFTRTIDLPLLGALLALMVIGLMVLYSAGNENPKLVIAQGSRYVIGLGGMWLLSRVSPAGLRSVTPLVFVGSLAPLLLVLLIGQGKHGNLWINLGVFYFQPSEVLKLSLPMMVAWFLHQRPLPPRVSTVLIAGGIIAVPTGLILLQPDFGTAMLVAISGAFVLFLAGLPWRWFAAAGAGVAAIADDATKAKVQRWMDRSPDKPDVVADKVFAAAERGEFLILPTQREPGRWRLKRWFPNLYFRMLLKMAAQRAR